jgi:hypothetical protein
MIFKAENILGGCLFSSVYGENGKVDSATILNSDEVAHLVLCIEHKMGFSKDGALTLYWNPEVRGAVELLVGTSHCTIDRESLPRLVTYLRTKADGPWTYGGEAS